MAELLINSLDDAFAIIITPLVYWFLFIYPAILIGNNLLYIMTTKSDPVVRLFWLVLFIVWAYPTIFILYLALNYWSA